MVSNHSTHIVKVYDIPLKPFLWSDPTEHRARRATPNTSILPSLLHLFTLQLLQNHQLLLLRWPSGMMSPSHLRVTAPIRRIAIAIVMSATSARCVGESFPLGTGIWVRRLAVDIIRVAVKFLGQDISYP